MTVTTRVKASQPTVTQSSMTFYVMFLIHLHLEEYKYKYIPNMNLSCISFN